MLILQKHPRKYAEYLTCGVAFAPNGTLLASGHGYTPKINSYLHGEVKLWDLTKGAEIATVMQCRNYVKAVCFSPDGKLLAVGAGDRSIRLFDVATLKEVSVWRGHTRVAASVDFSPDGKKLVSGSADKYGGHGGGELRLWRVPDGEVIETISEPAGIWGAAFSPDGKFVAYAGETAKIVDVKKGRVVKSLDHRVRVRCLCYSPDGAMLATAAGWEINCWDLATNEHLSFQGHQHGVVALAFSPDGRILASAGADNKVRFWDMCPGLDGSRLWKTGVVRERNCFVWGGAKLRCVAFSAQGMTMAAGGGGKDTLIVWDVDR